MEWAGPGVVAAAEVGQHAVQHPVARLRVAVADGPAGGAGEVAQGAPGLVGHGHPVLGVDEEDPVHHRVEDAPAAAAGRRRAPPARRWPGRAPRRACRSARARAARGRRGSAGPPRPCAAARSASAPASPGASGGRAPRSPRPSAPANPASSRSGRTSVVRSTSTTTTATAARASPISAAIRSAEAASRGRSPVASSATRMRPLVVRPSWQPRQPGPFSTGRVSDQPRLAPAALGGRRRAGPAPPRPGSGPCRPRRRGPGRPRRR